MYFKTDYSSSIWGGKMGSNSKQQLDANLQRIDSLQKSVTPSKLEITSEVKLEANSQKIISFSAVDFIAKSAFLSIVMTFVPVIVLLVIWNLGFATTGIMVSWIMFALFWTFYVILKLSDRIIR